jgi:ribosomal protein S18 acetylase RimI-like enzyme
MVSYRETTATNDDAMTLLTEYFTSRDLTFAGGPGTYRKKFPVEEDFTPPRGVLLIVEDENGRDVGCGGIREIEGVDGGRRFEVKHLYLRPETRGKGMGRSLLAELERRAMAFGADELVLDTNDSLTAAAGLYKSSGFETIAPYNDNPNATTWYRKAL